MIEKTRIHPLQHYDLHLMQAEKDNQLGHQYTVANIAAQVSDMTDTVVTEAIIHAAADAGVTDLYLIDKAFIQEAIQEKLEREDPQPLTYEELLKLHGEPVYVTVPGKPHRSKWCIVDLISPQPGLLGKEYFCPILVAATPAVKVYRHKPKEEV